MSSVRSIISRSTISIFLVILSLIFLAQNLYSLSIVFIIISIFFSGDKLIKGFVHLVQMVFHTFLALVIISISLFLLMMVLVYFFT